MARFPSPQAPRPQLPGIAGWVTGRRVFLGSVIAGAATIGTASATQHDRPHRTPPAPTRQLPRIPHERTPGGGRAPIPTTTPGRIDRGTLASRYRPGETGWAIGYPPGSTRRVPLVIALHQMGGTHRSAFRSKMRVDAFLAAHVAGGGTPFAIATIDGGRTYWHPREDGEDASATVVEEFVPLLARRGFDTSRIGLLGWSMGGYGALRLAGLLGPERVSAVAVAGPAVWVNPLEAATSGFETPAAYRKHTIFEKQGQLRGIPVRIDCGTSDRFYRSVVAYAAGFRHEITTNFVAGGHNTNFWRRALPDQVAFLGAHLA
ncbi:MAG: alpha/beta hydrolase [Nocardioides sp.]